MAGEQRARRQISRSVGFACTGGGAAHAFLRATPVAATALASL